MNAIAENELQQEQGKLTDVSTFSMAQKTADLRVFLEAVAKVGEEPPSEAINDNIHLLGVYLRTLRRLTSVLTDGLLAYVRRHGPVAADSQYEWALVDGERQTILPGKFLELARQVQDRPFNAEEFIKSLPRIPKGSAEPILGKLLEAAISTEPTQTLKRRSARRSGKR